MAGLEYEIRAWQDLFAALLLLLPRTAIIFAIAPFLSSRILSGQARRTVLIALVMILYPTLAPTVDHTQIQLSELILIISKEMAIGLMLGFLIALAFWGIQAAGFLIDNQRGASIASSIDPMTGSDSSPMGTFFLHIIITLTFSTGLFLSILGLIYESYRIWPVTSMQPLLKQEGTTFFLLALDFVMQTAVLLAAPILLAMFLSEFGLALVGRFAPQLQVFFLAMPVKSAIAMFLLSIYVVFLLGYMRDSFFHGEVLFQNFLGITDDNRAVQ